MRTRKAALSRCIQAMWMLCKRIPIRVPAHKRKLPAPPERGPEEHRMKSEKTSAQPHGEVVQGQPEGEHPPFALKKGVLAGGIALRKGNTKADETEQDAADPFDILGGKLSSSHCPSWTARAENIAVTANSARSARRGIRSPFDACSIPMPTLSTLAAKEARIMAGR